MNDEALEPEKEQPEVQAARVVEELKKFAFANMADFIRFFPDGRVEIFDYDKAREVGAVISVTARARGTATKIALPHKQTALVLLGQHLGMLPVQRGRKPDLAAIIAKKVGR